MKKEATKKQKKLYTLLLVATIAAVILAVTLSLVFGLSGSKPDDGDILGPGMNTEDPGGDPTGGDPNDGDPTGGDPTGGDPNDGDPTGGDPVILYEMPVSDYQPGLQFDVTQVVKSSTYGWYTTHNGSDFIAAKGAAVKSAYDGTVKSVGYDGLDGYFVIIEQSDGIISTYKSLGTDIKVEKGDTVKTGAIIGSVSDSMGSEQNEGYHLHLEMKKDGGFIDPMGILAPDDK